MKLTTSAHLFGSGAVVAAIVLSLGGHYGYRLTMAPPDSERLGAGALHVDPAAGYPVVAVVKLVRGTAGRA